MPNGSVGRADIVELHAGEFLQCVLHRRAVFAHDVGVVAHHLQPVVVAVHLLVDDTAVQGAKAAEGVHGEEDRSPSYGPRGGFICIMCRGICSPLGGRMGGCQRHHRLGPVNHRCQDEVQGIVAQLQRVAVLHLDGIRLRAQSVEAAHHAERLLVADDFHLRVVFFDECQRPAVVGLHVVHHDIVDGTLTDHLLDVLQEGDEEVHLDGVHEAHLVADDEIGIVAHSVGQRPQALEEVFVAVVDAHVIDFVCYFCHNYDV